MDLIRDEDVLTLKDFNATAEKPILVIPPGQTKEHTAFQVYNFLLEKFDQAYLGYPTLFFFENHSQGVAKAYMSGSEVGARIADCMETLNARAIISIERNGSIIEVHFTNDDSKEFASLLDMQVIGNA